MFTGIIQTIGRVKACEQRGGDLRLTIEADSLTDRISTGDSVAVNGCCLTAVEPSGRQFSADVSRETLAHTTLGQFGVDTAVNLETAATPSTLLGGHMVSGHVDAVARVIKKTPDARSERIDFELPDALARYVASKGSVCIDGVSLTVNEVAGKQFSVNIVPHTQAVTIFGQYQVGTKVNLEVDVIARYLERLMVASPEKDLRAVLADNGFIR